MFGTSDINERKLRPVWKYNFFAKIRKVNFLPKIWITIFQNCIFCIKTNCLGVISIIRTNAINNVSNFHCFVYHV